MRIESTDNQYVKLFEQLKHKKYRTRTNKFVVEGVHLVELALTHGQAEYVFIDERQYVVRDEALYKGDSYIADLVCPFAYVNEKITKKLAQTKTSQGVFAICRMREMEYDEGSIVCFDGVADPGNVGTIIRSAIAFGVHNFYFTADSVDPYNDKVIRASQGALFFSELFFADKDSTFTEKLVRVPRVYTLELTGDSLREVAAERAPFVLIVGNEAQGVRTEAWREFKPQRLTIPMQENSESLNVAIATSIALYDLTK